MGDYADDAVEAALLYHLEYGEDDLIIQRQPEYYEFIKVLKETEKAWQLLMTGGATHWIPKSKCSITTIPDENGLFILTIPHWLRKKKMDEALAKAGF